MTPKSIFQTGYRRVAISPGTDFEKQPLEVNMKKDNQLKSHIYVCPEGCGTNVPPCVFVMFEALI